LGERILVDDEQGDHQGPPSSSRVKESDHILAVIRSKMIGLGLNGSKIDPKRNDLRLYESLLRHDCRKVFLHAIWAMR